MRELSSQEECYYDLDVLHLGYYIEPRHSIRKMIENVICSCPTFKQNALCLTRGKEEEALGFINRTRPKILHLHFSSLFEKELFTKLAYRPVIIGTVHGDVRSPYREFVDLLICIHQPGYDKNTGERALIENSPLVDKKDIDAFAANERTACLAARFHRYCFSEKTVPLYGQIKGDVYIYGYSKVHAVAEDIVHWCNKHKNIHVLPWSDFVEKSIVKHALYAFIPPAFNSHLCYGLNVMEAVALGIPTVAVFRKCRQEYVRDGYNGFVAKTEAEFVARCNLLLSDDTLYREIKKNAVAHALSLTNSMPIEYGKVYSRYLLR